jgi:anaerobic ribonucleoside-triphosphate reductase
MCSCVEDITEGLNYCEKCGEAICPCGSHDVSQVSRVTGYLADVDGMNMGKQQEIKDRMRYVLLDGAWIKRGGNRD